jgi:Domain of unknown function (DUF4432)
MKLWGKDWTRRELLDRIGRLSQLGGLTPFEFNSGKARGVRAVRVQTGTGLDFSVLIDKGLDIFDAFYLSKSLCWQSPVGIVHPAYYDARDVQWLKSFPGGLLSTCGLSSAGGPSEDQGELFGLHGSIGNTPADTVVLSEDWEKDECKLTVAGVVRETRVHGQNLVLRRSIETYMGSRTISVRDTVENQGFREAPVMLLYHLNFGFPFVTDRSAIFAAPHRTLAQNSNSEQTIESWNSFESPTAGIEERVYYHDMKIDSSGNVNVVLVADRDTSDLGVSIGYGGKNLPRFIQWKMTGANHFALGLEPANCLVEGRAAERARGTLQILRPGEQKEFAITIAVLDGRDEVHVSMPATA